MAGDGATPLKKDGLVRIVRPLAGVSYLASSVLVTMSMPVGIGSLWKVEKLSLHLLFRIALVQHL